MAEDTLPIVDPNDPYAQQYEIAKRKLQKAKEEALKQTAETYGARGRFYGGQLPKQEAKVEEGYGQQLSDVAQNIAVERAAEEKAAQRVKEAQIYQTSERLGAQSWSSAENVLGRAFTTGERNAVQAWQSLSQDKQQNWQSAEAALGRTFTTQERNAIQSYQTTEREANQIWQASETAIGRKFTTNERKAVQAFNSLEAGKQRDWGSAEAALGRTFTTKERNAIQAYQTKEREQAQAWQAAETAAGRKFTNEERLSIQDWQKAQTEAGQAWQKLENDKNRAITMAELMGYFGGGGETQYTIAGQQQQAVAGETAEQQAAANKLGFKNVTEMNTYQADPEMAKRNGIYNNYDKREIVGLVNKGPSGADWLRDRFQLSYEQAVEVVKGF